MAQKKTKNLTNTAIMLALIFVVTWLVKIPVPGAGGAYLNFGDIVICMCAYIIGGPWVAVAAAAGSALADLAVGSAVYMIPTLLIKGVMGLVASALMKRRKFGFYLLGAVAAESIMVAGYFLFEYFFFDAAYAAVAFPFNMIQFGGCIAFVIIFYKVSQNIAEYISLRERQ